MTSPVAKATMRAAGLAHAEKRFREDGDKYAVFEAITFAAAGREPVPEWAREALWAINRGLSQGEIADLNAAFNWQPKGEFNKRSRTETARYRRHAQAIFMELYEARRRGQGMTAERFEAIAEMLNQATPESPKIGRSLVQRVWMARKAELLRVTVGEPTGIHAFVLVDFWDR